MNNKTVFVRTSKGEAEASGQTSLLFGDAKRAFILINNKSTVEELRKHAAPSLRPQFDEMLEQLELDDFICDKDDTGQKKSQSGKGANIPKMSVPKISIPIRVAEQAEFETGAEDELDFTTVMKAPSKEAMAAEADRARVEAETRMRAEAEARARAEAEARMRAQADKAKAEAEARMRAEAEAKTRAEAETRMHAEAEVKARAEAEARMRAEEEAKARARAEMEAKVRVEAEARARVHAELEAGMRSQADDARAVTGKNHAARSMIATVLFFDVVGYTKQSVAKQIELKGQFNSLISGFIGHVDEKQHIILDTGDGAAIGFMQHPEDALDVAMKFRAAVTANNHRDYPELKVRAGIHLGPVNVVKDMNGRLNMVGDGINDAQRIMSFAGMDEIYVSRSYFDVISRLTADSARLFKYNGTQKDKHGREHQVYLVLGEGAAAPAYPVSHEAGGLESLKLDLSSLMRESASGEAASQINAAPEEIPTSKPSSRANRRAISMESWLDT